MPIIRPFSSILIRNEVGFILFMILEMLEMIASEKKEPITKYTPPDPVHNCTVSSTITK